MEITVCNFAKSRLETIDINITRDNTTWFEDIAENKGIRMLTDIEGCLLISEYNYDYPVLIYNVTRKDIDCNIHTALELKESQM
jgi:prophage tail gpP-like protein